MITNYLGMNYELTTSYLRISHNGHENNQSIRFPKLRQEHENA